MKIIKTLLIAKTHLTHNFNHKVYPLNNAVSSTFTHTIGLEKIDHK